jgi:integrase
MLITVFTDIMVRKMKPDTKKFIRSEGNGFSFRVMPSGAKTWLYIYSFAGKRREINLGCYPEVTLKTARAKFEEARRKVKNGVDPVVEEQEKAEARRRAPTVKDLCDEYLERHAKRFKKSWVEDERILAREVVPAWGRRQAADIIKRDVLKVVEAILDRGSPGMANNSFQVIRKMFNFAVERDILPFSPCTGLKLPAPKLSRDRTLSEQEIKAFWNNLDGCAISSGIRAALRLTLVTAQRPGEVIGLHTDEIDGEWWHLPAERSKNGKAHRVPLTPLAREIIDRAIAEIKEARGLEPDQKYSGFVFPTPHLNKVRPMDQHAMALATKKNLARPLTDSKGRPLLDASGKRATENRFGIDHFTPHDLRRTAATRMAESGEMDEVIDAVLNHAKQGVIRVYNLYRYDKEKQAALESWDRRLRGIITGETSGKVISLRRHRSEG